MTDFCSDIGIINLFIWTFTLPVGEGEVGGGFRNEYSRVPDFKEI